MGNQVGALTSGPSCGLTWRGYEGLTANNRVIGPVDALGRACGSAPARMHAWKGRWLAQFRGLSWLARYAGQPSTTGGATGADHLGHDLRARMLSWLS